MGQQRAGGQLLGSGDDSGSAERRTEESRRRLGGSGRAQSENGRPDSRRVANWGRSGRSLKFLQHRAHPHAQKKYNSPDQFLTGPATKACYNLSTLFHFIGNTSANISM